MNNNYFESYNKRTHVIGRISSAIALVMLVGAPFLIGRMLGAMPDIGAVGKAFLSVGLVWTVSSVVEFLVYTPMLGAGGGYLAFITGNLINITNMDRLHKQPLFTILCDSRGFLTECDVVNLLQCRHFLIV